MCIVLTFFISLSIFGLFNLAPIPPLDDGRVLEALLIRTEFSIPMLEFPPGGSFPFGLFKIKTAGMLRRFFVFDDY